MPDSGRSAALGFAKQSKIPFEEGIVPNRFVGRTFILPNQIQRDRAVAMKLNIIPDVVSGKRIVIVEDSVVRGTTTRSKMRAIRRAGAREIHLRVSCPPIRHPCFYGIDFPTSTELIAHNRTVEEIEQFLEVDSLAYLSLEGMLACMPASPRTTIARPAGAGSIRFRSTTRRANSASSAISCRCFEAGECLSADEAGQHI
jgi:amidophosphoribosyltransferase